MPFLPFVYGYPSSSPRGGLKGLSVTHVHDDAAGVIGPFLVGFWTDEPRPVVLAHLVGESCNKKGDGSNVNDNADDNNQSLHITIKRTHQ